MDYDVAPHRPVAAVLGFEEFREMVQIWRKPKTGETWPTVGPMPACGTAAAALAERAKVLRGVRRPYAGVCGGELNSSVAWPSIAGSRCRLVVPRLAHGSLHGACSCCGLGSGELSGAVNSSGSTSRPGLWLPLWEPPRIRRPLLTSRLRSEREGGRSQPDGGENGRSSTSSPMNFEAKRLRDECARGGGVFARERVCPMILVFAGG